MRALLSAEAFGGNAIPQPRGVPRPVRQRRPARPVLLAVAGCVVAAAIHLLVTPEHFGESKLYGVFFVVSAVAQIVAAWVLWTTQPSVVAGNRRRQLCRDCAVDLDPNGGHPTQSRGQ